MSDSSRHSRRSVLAGGGLALAAACVTPMKRPDSQTDRIRYFSRFGITEALTTTPWGPRSPRGAIAPTCSSSTG